MLPRPGWVQGGGQGAGGEGGRGGVQGRPGSLTPVLPLPAQVELFGQCPPIEKMDAALSNLKACKHLSLSTNNIGKITSLAGMENLEILSVGRNQLRSLDVDGVSDTLQELWASYNLVGSLAGVEKLQKLRTLYVSNNNIKSIDEVNRLADLEHLEDVLFINNPFFNDFADKAEYRLELLRRLPKLKKIDGVPVDVEEREAAAAG